MTTLRALDATGIAGKNDGAGAAPMLQWIELAQLRVDDGYQRPIGERGRRNIRAIAGEFRWSKFSPVVVAPAESGLFVIIDGQHRATAAMACGFTSVPCQVVSIDRQEQARAFRDINARTTSVHYMALHRAAVEAGDEMARRINAAAEKAGVRILPYPVQVLKQRPGETMAITAIGRAIEWVGDDGAAIVLRMIVRMGGDKPGMLLGPVILGVARALAPALAVGGGVLDAALKRLESANLLREFGRAQDEAKSLGLPVFRALGDRLAKHLARQG